MTREAKASGLVPISWNLRRETKLALGEEASRIGIAEGTLARILLDWAIAELKGGRVNLLSRRGTETSQAEEERQRADTERTVPGNPT